MAKLSYPSNRLSEIEDFYVKSILNCTNLNRIKVDEFLRESNLGYSFDEFLILPFEKLAECAEILKNDIKDEIISFKSRYSRGLNELKKIFNYTKILSPAISPFFMKYSSSLNIRTCSYCNIDFVNSYIPFHNDYKDFFDLINSGIYDDLIKLKGIGEKSAKKIIKLRSGTIKDLISLNQDLKPESKIIENLLLNKNANDNGIFYETLKNQKNHYTVDHILPQGDYPYFSLCLYNLVPSCYTCNSKLKGDKLLSKNLKDINKISPTSNTYENPLNFKLYYDKSVLNNNSSFDEDQFNVKLETNILYNDFLNLQGRYNFHKKIALKLIQKRKIYSDSQISEISALLKSNDEEVKRHLFGSILYETDSNEPFEKYSKDIAKELGIIS